MRTTLRVLRDFSILMVIAAVVAVPGMAKNGKQAGAKNKAKVQAATGPKVIWQDPGDIASRNLFYGSGGEEHAPKGTEYKFIAEDTSGTTPKFDVKDENGVTWRAKLGIDAKCDTAAARLLWSVGYFAPEDYYLPSLRARGMTEQNMKRGHKWFAPTEDGTVTGGIRLKRKLEGEKKLGEWAWFNNPFQGSKEFDGLRVMMALLGNWDTATKNNKIFSEKNGEIHYEITDLDATFGKTGDNAFNRSRGVLGDYQKSRFLAEVNGQVVDFAPRPRPSIVQKVDLPAKVLHTQIAQVLQNVPLEHVQWITGLLSQLSRDQIRDAFRAAGFPPEEVDGFTDVVQKRIEALKNLGTSSVPTAGPNTQ
ncbi:MAG TPA: hypothetical protein VKV95_02925 [Terriglobia bacterium]|nr:hypothetical protein [Terriglobia bacterium]